MRAVKGRGDEGFHQLGVVGWADMLDAKTVPVLMGDDIAEVAIVVGCRPGITVRRDNHHVTIVGEVVVCQYAIAGERAADNTNIAARWATGKTKCRAIVRHFGV